MGGLSPREISRIRKWARSLKSEPGTWCRCGNMEELAFERRTPWLVRGEISPGMDKPDLIITYHSYLLSLNRHCASFTRLEFNHIVYSGAQQG